MNEKVVAIDGSGPVAQTVGDPVPEVVECLEDLLERARSGALSGFAAALYYSDDTISWRFAHGRFRRAAMIGAMEVVKLDLTHELIAAKDYDTTRDHSA